MVEAVDAAPRGALEMENASAQEIAAAEKIEIVESFMLPNIELTGRQHKHEEDRM
jgi:hypothetical protein